MGGVLHIDRTYRAKVDGRHTIDAEDVARIAVENGDECRVRACGRRSLHPRSGEGGRRGRARELVYAAENFLDRLFAEGRLQPTGV